MNKSNKLILWVICQMLEKGKFTKHLPTKLSTVATYKSGQVINQQNVNNTNDLIMEVC